jgi:hypothetical protein
LKPSTARIKISSPYRNHLEEKNPSEADFAFSTSESGEGNVGAPLGIIGEGVSICIYT